MPLVRKPDHASLLFGLVTAAFIIAGAAGPAHALRWYERPAWMVGIGWAVGPGELTNASSFTGEYEPEALAFLGEPGATAEYRTSAAPSIRFGRMLGQTFMVDVYWGNWLVDMGEEPIKVRRTLQSVGMGISVYPGNPTGASGGIYLRGGAGFGFAGTGVKKAEQGTAQKRGDRHTDDGYAFFGEGGYEVWLTSSITFGLNIAGYYYGIDGDYVNTAWYSSFGFELNSHF
jgi:hypothetical protein